ncbi:MAG: helix-turn-helix domain-containing protein [Clostridia bacterium]|nr:helix-turn-helix domain-containing protein [Clostridia bacterium]
MEKKTIGGFISALRKANGMTQKDLAERLNVSDKSVSRWECDEGAPDLSLIPVIAEIFGVTCDELLRGERKSPEERAEPAAEAETSPKAEKQLQWILKSAMSQYKNRTYIAMGISVVGLIAALICNLAFLKASLGFLVGAVFFAASIVCQIVFLNRAMFSVDEEEFHNLPDLNVYKRDTIRLTEISIGLTVLFIGFTFPLVLIDAYLGLGADSMLLFGAIGMAAFLAIYAVILWFVNARLLKNGVYVLREKEAQVYHHNHRLQKILAIVLVVLIAVTALVQEICTSIWGPFSIMKGITFEDYDSFVNFMEQDIPYEDRSSSNSHVRPDDTFSVSVPADDTIYYDQYGNIIDEYEFRHETLVDEDGNVLCEYDRRNESVCQIQYGNGKDMLPITVSTYSDLSEARQTVEVRNILFGFVYGIEVVGVILAYVLERKKTGVTNTK